MICTPQPPIQMYTICDKKEQNVKLSCSKNKQNTHESIYLLKQEVKLEVKGHRGHEEGGKAVGGGVIEERETGSCLVSQPGVAGERQVGEKVEETRGVQKDNRMMGVER